MLNSGFLGEIYGCISTGKEANVYHATGAGGADLAVKVYKTSILAFKDRDRRARRTLFLPKWLRGMCSLVVPFGCAECASNATGAPRGRVVWRIMGLAHAFGGALPCRYVTGDFRFRCGYCRSNPRKMVKVGACTTLRRANGPTVRHC